MCAHADSASQWFSSTVNQWFSKRVIQSRYGDLTVLLIYCLTILLVTLTNRPGAQEQRSQPEKVEAPQLLPLIDCQPGGQPEQNQKGQP